MVREYYRLIKPGIVYANVLTAIAGFLLAAKTHVDFRLLAAVVLGTGLVIASACVVNNCMDRSIDAVMRRTQKRALVTGVIRPWQALLYAGILGFGGFASLRLWTNHLAFGVGVVAYLTYVVLYGAAKRKSTHGTLVGSVAGSASIVAGYVAVAGQFDAAAAILFAMMTTWQMPHFYAIAVHRQEDYRQAGIPVLSVSRGAAAARRHSIVYMVAFLLSILALELYGYVGIVFVAVMGLAGLYWLSTGLRRYEQSSPNEWARKVFKTSLSVMLLMSCMVAMGGILP